MSKACGGIDWWKRLHPWHKIAVVLFYPSDASSTIAIKLELPSRNPIVRVRTTIKDRRGAQKPLPEACSPETVHEVVIPPDAPKPNVPSEISGKIPRKFKITRPYRRKKKKPVKLLLPPASEKVTLCCTKDCGKIAVRKIPFCADCARLVYKPMPKQIEELIANTS